MACTSGIWQRSSSRTVQPCPWDVPPPSLTCYAQRDLKEGTFTEEQIQEFVDHFIMKLRLIKFARTPEYNDLFSGDPSLGNRVHRRRGHRRTPHGNQNVLPFPAHPDQSGPGSGAEPDRAVVHQTAENFKKFCAKTSIDTSSIQYENDDLMRVTHGDDYAIACCVSSMRVGKEMQFFGARANLAKCLLYAINGGVDEMTKKQMGPNTDRYRRISGL